MKKQLIFSILIAGLFGFVASANAGLFDWLSDLLKGKTEQKEQTFGGSFIYPYQGGTGTSSVPVYGQMLVGTSAGVYQLTATSSLGITGSGGSLIGSALTKGNFIVGDDSGLSQATSTIFISSTGNVGIGTTSPFRTLSVAGNLTLDQFSNYQLDGLTVLSATSTTFNTLVGFYAGANIVSTSTANTSGLYNTALGYEALRYATSTDYNTAVGYGALRMSSSASANNSGGENTAIGYYALYSNTTGLRNAGVGYRALQLNTTGNYNTGMGGYALYSNTTGSFNFGLGYGTLYKNISGVSNIGIGYNVLYNTTGNYNTGIGHTALQFNTTGTFNIVLGYQALLYNKSATSTVAIGYRSARGTPYYNNQGGVYIGYQAGYSAATSSDYNTLLGYQAGYGITTGSYNIIIGQNVEAPSVTGAQQLNIGNLIYGTGVYNGSTVSSAPVAGSVGIGTTTPAAKLSVNQTSATTIGQYIAGFYNSTADLFRISTSTLSATSTAFKIDSKGKVGIGTTTYNGYQLAVQGIALADSWDVYSDIYKGDALTALKGIKAKTGTTGDWVSVDHDSLPEGVLSEAPQTHWKDYWEKLTEQKEIITKDEEGNDIISYEEIVKYKKAQTIISEKEYNALPLEQKGVEVYDYTLQTMSISNLTVMNTQAILQLQGQIDVLKGAKLGSISLGIINPQGNYEDIRQEILQLKVKIENQQKEIDDLKRQFQEISLWSLILKIFGL